MASFFVDRSADLSEGGDILYTPNMTEMSASAKSDATAVNYMAALIVQLKHSIMRVYETSNYKMSFVQ